MRLVLPSDPNPGVLRFITEEGKEIVTSGVPFMVEEVEPAPVKPEAQSSAASAN
jgi:hypothetical protein